MLYDNSSRETSVATWIQEQTLSGKLDVTSGYFTVGILAFLNIEINVVGQSTAADYEPICRWFDDLWQRDPTHAYKTVEGRRVPFKKYLAADC